MIFAWYMVVSYILFPLVWKLERDFIFKDQKSVYNNLESNELIMSLLWILAPLVIPYCFITWFIRAIQ